MPYVWSIVVVLVAVVVMAVVAVRVLGPVRRLSTAAALLSRRLDRDGGMLTARVAALRVRVADRRA